MISVGREVMLKNSEAVCRIAYNLFYPEILPINMSKTYIQINKLKIDHDPCTNLKRNEQKAKHKGKQDSLPLFKCCCGLKCEVIFVAVIMCKLLLLILLLGGFLLQLQYSYCCCGLFIFYVFCCFTALDGWSITRLATYRLQTVG